MRIRGICGNIGAFCVEIFQNSPLVSRRGLHAGNGHSYAPPALIFFALRDLLFRFAGKLPVLRGKNLFNWSARSTGNLSCILFSPVTQKKNIKPGLLNKAYSDV
jgi:hypothetical protein